MIRFVDVTKSYGPTSASAALEAINIEFRKGEFAFITGPSGAGKSTLLKLIYAAERPTRGDVFVENRSVGRLHPRSIPYLRRNLGVVLQDFELLPRRTILDNVGLALEVCGVGRDDTSRRRQGVL
jgi:cell division transport system ATP-binding protein